MDEERQDLICKVIGQMTKDLENSDVDQIIGLLIEVPSDKLKEYLKGS